MSCGPWKRRHKVTKWPPHVSVIEDKIKESACQEKTMGVYTNINDRNNSLINLYAVRVRHMHVVLMMYSALLE